MYRGRGGRVSGRCATNVVDEVVDVDPISCVTVGAVDDGVADWIWAAIKMSLSFSAGVVQVISPTVNVKPGGTITEDEKITDLIAIEPMSTPPTWCATVELLCSAVYQGVSPR